MPRSENYPEECRVTLQLECRADNAQSILALYALLEAGDDDLCETVLDNVLNRRFVYWLEQTLDHASLDLSDKEIAAVKRCIAILRDQKEAS